MELLDGASAQHLIGQYGYGAIFVIVMLESAGIPMPGETILVAPRCTPAPGMRWTSVGSSPPRDQAQYRGPPEISSEGLRRTNKWACPVEDKAHDAHLDRAAPLISDARFSNQKGNEFLP